MNVLAGHGWKVDAAVEDPVGILVRSADMHEYQFNEKLLAIARAGAGTNNIPIQRCSEKGIVVFNTPGANAEAVKELVICAMLLAARDIVGGIEWARSIADKGDEVPALVEKGKAAFVGPELEGKSLGVIGLGAVGAKIANTALALGMEVYGYDPFLSVDAAWQLSRSVKHARELGEIYANCDYITLHVPYMDSTKYMINAEAIAKMKNNVRIVNIARNELVDNKAMLEALDNGKVARYVTDFPDGVITKAPNVIPIPHLGASTPESEEKCAVMAAEELYEYITHGNIINSVNMPSVSLERVGEARLCVIHRNVPKQINSFLELVSARNLNVEHMVNKSKGEYAYTIIDVSGKIDDEMVSSIRGMGEVLRVRVL